MSRINKNGAAFQFALDLHTGVPVYRQLIDQVRAGIASGSLAAGDQLPTVRQLAVDLEINPNTVMRAYRELELGGLLETHQGTGTFISSEKPEKSLWSANANSVKWLSTLQSARGRGRIHSGRVNRTPE